MINGLSFDVEDWFQVENLRSVCAPQTWSSRELRVEANVDLILDMLSRYGKKATFFILGWIAERKPDLVRKINTSGHEIASHGYGHELVTQLNPEVFRNDVVRSKKILEDISGVEVVGYRAPNFSITQETAWAVDILKGSGYRYDSSIFPVSFHDRYGFAGVKNSKPFVFKNGLIEYPLTVYKSCNMRIPLGGGAYFRFLPYRLFRWQAKKINNSNEAFIFYLHPWEFDVGQPRIRVKLSYYMRHYFNIATTEIKFKNLLLDFEFCPLKELFEETPGLKSGGKTSGIRHDG